MGPASSRSGWIGVAAAAMMAILAVATALALPGAEAARGAVLAVCGVIVLALPGVLIAWSLRHDDALLPRVYLVLGAGVLSIGTVVIGGLVLNLLPPALGRWTWLGLAGLVLLSAWALAPDRMRRGGRRSLPRPPALPATLMLSGAAALAIAAIVVARLGVEQAPAPFSQLWIVRPADGTAAVEIGLENREGSATTYRLELWRGGQRIQSWDTLTLASGERWTVDVEPDLPDGVPLAARLYLSDTPDEVYRSVTLYGPLSAGAGSGG